jgi:hypothetical protein
VPQGSITSALQMHLPRLRQHWQVRGQFRKCMCSPLVAETRGRQEMWACWRVCMFAIDDCRIWQWSCCWQCTLLHSLPATAYDWHEMAGVARMVVMKY